MKNPMSSTRTVRVAAAFALLPVLAANARAQVPQREFKDAADKQAAFVAQVAEKALNQDIAILQRLDVPFAKPMVFTDVPAGEVVKAIRSSVKATIEFDSRAVGDSGGWEAVRVTCEPANVRQALDAVVRAISPEYEQYAVDVAAGIIVITDEAGLRTLRAQAQYPLESAIARLGAGAGDAVAIERTRAELEDFLTLTRHDAWDAHGGEIARMSWTGSIATVEATPAMHHDIRQRLAQLMAAMPPANLLWSVRIAELPDTTDAKAADAAVAARDALEKLAADGGAKIIAAPRVLAPSGEPAEITIGSDGDAVSVRVEPAGMRNGRVFVVRFSQRIGDVRRECTLRAVPGIRASMMIEGASGRRLIVDVEGAAEPSVKDGAVKDGTKGVDERKKG